jgi:hypothetical protein
MIIGTIGSIGCAAGNPALGPRSAANSVAPSAAAEGEVPCRVVGPSQVVASGAFVPAGVEAGLEDGRVTIRFARRKAQCRVASIPGGPGADEGPANCPRANPDLFATGSDVRPPYAGPGVAFLGFPLDGHRPSLEQSGGKRLLTWVDGDAVGGHSLHGQAVAGSGKAAGPTLDLSPTDVSVIGRPSVVISPDGRGVVAFLASNGQGFDVRATPIACESR